MPHLGTVGDTAQVLGLELIVEDIDRATALFVDVLGFELQQRDRFELFAGEMAVVTDGSIAITLLQPTTDGNEAVLPDRTPRLSQLVIGNVPGTQPPDVEQAAGSGLSIVPTSSGFYVTPESAEGALGLKTAIVVVSSGHDGET